MENIQFTTSGGHVVVLKPFITGKDERYINSVFIDDTEIKGGFGEKGSYSIKGNVVKISEDRAYETVIISIDGKTDNIADTVLSLPSKECNEIREKVNEITGEKKTAYGTAMI